MAYNITRFFSRTKGFLFSTACIILMVIVSLQNLVFAGSAQSYTISSATQTLTIASSNPSSGVSIAVSPNDNNGQGGGVTQFTRIYNSNSTVTLTAPSSAGGNSFQKWQRNGVDFSTNQTTIVTMDADYTMTALYVTAQPPLFQGFHDGAGCNTISGWAWDANNPSATVSVDIYDGNTFIATTAAGMYREDLLNVLGSPNHGFSFPTPASLKDGANHSISIKFSGTNTTLPGGPKTINCTVAVNLLGAHDGAGCNTISGWALDLNDPNNIVNVDIYEGTTLLGTIAATQFRQDLGIVFGSPYHGFTFPTPASLRDGQPHTITVKFAGTSTNLTWNTPQTFNCGTTTPDFQGSHDLGSCDTISGFAWDTNDPAGTINVAIYADGAFLAVVPAQQVYAGIGNGFHGFLFDIPASLKDGQPHSILVRYSGTSTSLSNSPRTIICGGPQQVLLNPGFELGEAFWSSTTGVITNSSGQAARSGIWKAWLCGSGAANTDTLSQSVTIPSTATSATLSFWLHVDTNETSTTTAFDTLRVQIRNAAGTVILSTLATYSNLNSAVGYSLKTFDVSSFRGQSIRVYFEGAENFTRQTSFVIDDAALVVQ